MKKYKSNIILFFTFILLFSCEESIKSEISKEKKSEINNLQEKPKQNIVIINNESNQVQEKDTILTKNIVVEQKNNNYQKKILLRDSIGIKLDNNIIRLNNESWKNQEFSKIEKFNKDFKYSILGEFAYNEGSMLIVEREYSEENIHWIVLLDAKHKLIDFIQSAYDNSEGSLEIKSDIFIDKIVIKEWDIYAEKNYTEHIYLLTNKGFAKKYKILNDISFKNNIDINTNKIVLVNNEKEFFEALADNTEIVVQCDTLNFTLENLEKELNIFETDDYWNSILMPAEMKLNSYYLLSGIVLYGYKNLIIRSKNHTNIISDNQYDNILTFKNCSNIILDNISIFHSPSTCNGSVLSLILSNKILINNCNLNGSGGVGANLIGVRDITFNEVDIYNNVFNAIYAVNSNEVKFKHCNIYNNHDRGEALIYSDISKLNFENCIVQGNESNNLRYSFLEVPENKTVFTNCDITDNAFSYETFLDTPLSNNRKINNNQIRKWKINLFFKYLKKELKSDHDNRNDELLSFFSKEHIIKYKDQTDKKYNFLYFYVMMKKKHFVIDDFEYVNNTDDSNKFIIIVNDNKSKNSVKWNFYFNHENLIIKFEEE